MKAFSIGAIALALFIGSTAFVYGKGKINSGKPVPYLGNNEASAKLIAKDYGGKDEQWMTFSQNLCRTLSQLSPTEQTEIWFGPK